jgi:hypothetical protein
MMSFILDIVWCCDQCKAKVREMHRKIPDRNPTSMPIGWILWTDNAKTKYHFCSLICFTAWGEEHPLLSNFKMYHNKGLIPYNGIGVLE